MSKKVTFFITDNIGEIHLILPIADELNKRNIETKIVFTSQMVYKTYKKFYEKNINSTLRNKLHSLKYFFNENRKNKIIRITSKIFNIVLNLNFILKCLKKSDVYFIESSFRTSFGRFLLEINNIIFKKSIFGYLHGLRPYFKIRNTSRVNAINRKFKIFHLAISQNKNESDEIILDGFDKAISVGNPLLSDYFTYFKKKISKFQNSNILILPRAIGEFLTEKEAAEYLLEVKRISEKYFPKNKLVLHLHLKDRSVFFKKFIESNNLKNITISSEDIVSEVMKAQLVICNLTSAIYIAYALDIPAVELFTRQKDLIKWYPDGNGVSPFFHAGFKCFYEFNSFESFMRDFNVEKFRFNLNFQFEYLNVSKLERAIFEN